MRELIRQKIVDALATQAPEFTRRTIRMPGVAGKAVSVIGPRRAGKTTLLWQVLADRLESGTPREGLLYFSFEDERLADMTVTTTLRPPPIGTAGRARGRGGPRRGPVV